ncbi:MAG: DUF389 domain-containing protein [Rubripirellula sp.]
MSLVFVISSEEELTDGTPWCRRLTKTAECDLHILVLGVDRKTLVEFARRKSAVLADQTVVVDMIEPEAVAVDAYARRIGCKTLLMAYRMDDSEMQQKIFEASSSQTIWVQAKQPPPETAEEVFAMVRRPSLITTLAAEKLLGFAPNAALCDIDQIHRSEDPLALIRSAIETKKISKSSLVLCGIEDTENSDQVYRSALDLMNEIGSARIGLVHPGHSFAQHAAAKIHRWAASIAPTMGREQRTELAENLKEGSHPNLEFLGLMSAAAMLASFGLLQNSAAVIIGAMLIAPLMTPILGAGMALSQGNRPLFQSALLTVALGFFGALTASVLFGWLYLSCGNNPVITDEMWARCGPSPLDFCVGLVGGIAASYARTRQHLSSALAGAAIAAALVPPISTAGLQLAFRAWNWEDPKGSVIVGPLLLVSINVLTIMVGSSFVLWVRGMRSDNTFAIKDRWTVRMVALLLTLAVLTLIWILQPDAVAGQ